MEDVPQVSGRDINTKTCSFLVPSSDLRFVALGSIEGDCVRGSSVVHEKTTS